MSADPIVGPDGTVPAPDGDSAATEFVVIGVGADGWPGLGEAARDELRSAGVVFGSRRQNELLRAAGIELSAELVDWTSPMSAHLAEVLGSRMHAGRRLARVHILASGDPMFHGVGTTIIDAVGPDRVRVLPTVSSAALACARLGWDATGVRVVTAVSADVAGLIPELTDGRRILVLSRDETTPAAVAEILVANGFGASPMTVLEQLGGPAEQIHRSRAQHFALAPGDRLNIVAIDCHGPRRSRLPGLPDEAYENDGQLTKAVPRALTVCALRPGGAQLLWDVGSGSGSVAIEWLRADPAGRAIAFERDPDRRERLRRNAARHGVADRLEVAGAVPEALAGATTPDAVFLGGGLDEQVLAVAYDALSPGGRLVANAVAVETQRILGTWYRRHGGTLRRLSVETVAPLGTMTTWRPALPLEQWVVEKPVVEKPVAGASAAESSR